MKGFVFVAAVALACCVTTCGALMCPACCGAGSKAACQNGPQVTCNGTNNMCMAVQLKTGGVETWAGLCAGAGLCDKAGLLNGYACDSDDPTSVCVYCCNTGDGCIGTAEFKSTAARISVVTMTTTALAALLAIAAGF